jgi:hypothetical protein
MALDPVKTLHDVALEAVIVTSYGRRRPGLVIECLKPERRDALRELTSDQAQKMVLPAWFIRRDGR